MPWPDNLAAVQRAPAMRPRSSDFSSSVEATRSAARQAGPFAICPVAQPPEGDRAPRLQLVRGMAAKAVPHPVLDLAEGLLHKVQRVLLPRDVPAPPALTWAPPQGGRHVERARHRAGPGRAAARFIDGLGENLGDPWSLGHPGQPEQPLVPRVHYRG